MYDGVSVLNLSLNSHQLLLKLFSKFEIIASGVVVGPGLLVSAPRPPRAGDQYNPLLNYNEFEIDKKQLMLCHAAPLKYLPNYLVAICDSICVSRAASSRTPVVLLQKRGNSTVVSATVGCTRDQPFRCESAAFFNENIIREIITGIILQKAAAKLANKGINAG